MPTIHKTDRFKPSGIFEALQPSHDKEWIAVMRKINSENKYIKLYKNTQTRAL